MSEPAISVSRLTKVYRRYASNGWRAVSLLGLPVPQRYYDQFWALNDISLSIGKGERVALIGRNGAGKSTLLRHISGELTPTAGNVTVRGEVKALFGLGDGFHPEFSGIDNVRTALAMHGLSGPQIPRILDDIVDFSELEEFIHRPIKEYSAGMYARLAFATATATCPDILIIDEILGAGDAYFVGKCLQRIRSITSSGTTVLFVSHDMSSALMLCTRGIWIHQGRLRADSDMVSIARSYQAHIREEQELALRARTMKLSKKALLNREQATLFRLIGTAETAPAKPLHVARIAFGSGPMKLGELDLGHQEASSEIAPIVDFRTMNWGKSIGFRGRPSRPFGDFGGSFVHAPFSIQSSGWLAHAPWIELDVVPSPTHEVEIQFFPPWGAAYERIGSVPAEGSADWKTLRFVLPVPNEHATEAGDASSAGPAPAPAPAMALDGTTSPFQPELFAIVAEPAVPALPAGIARIADFFFFDEEGARRHTLVTGRPIGATFLVETGLLPRLPIAVVAIYRPDGTLVSQIISPAEERRGVPLPPGRIQIELRADELRIGPGDYIISAAVFRELDPAREPEDCAYDLHDRSYALKIVEDDINPYPSGIVRQNARWSFTSSKLLPETAGAPSPAAQTDHSNPITT